MRKIEIKTRIMDKRELILTVKNGWKFWSRFAVKDSKELRTYLKSDEFKEYAYGVFSKYEGMTYDEMYKTDFTQIDVDKCVNNWPTLDQVRLAAEKLFAGEPYAELGITEVTAKYGDKTEVRRQLELVKADWPELKRKLQEQCYTYDEMYRYLSIVGAPVKPEDVGISKSQMLADVPFVRHIRRRYNLLDLGLRAGVLDTWVDGNVN